SLPQEEAAHGLPDAGTLGLGLLPLRLLGQLQRHRRPHHVPAHAVHDRRQRLARVGRLERADEVVGEDAAALAVLAHAAGLEGVLVGAGGGEEDVPRWAGVGAAAGLNDELVRDLGTLADAGRLNVEVADGVEPLLAVAGARPGVAVVEDDEAVRGREVVGEAAELLVDEEAEVAAGAPEDEGLVGLVGLVGGVVAVVAVGDLGAVAGIVEHGGAGGAGLPEVAAERLDDVVARGVGVGEDDDGR